MQNTSSTFIPARPSALAKAFWGRYFERSLRRSFHSVRVAGLEHVRRDVPVLFACTHGSWWDAALTIVLSLRVLRCEAIGMMEFKQLSKYRFFSRIGMFSVVREDPRSALASLRYAAAELQRLPQALWMFPQGTLVHQEVRPIVCEPGAAIVASMVPDLVVIPVAIRYELLREQGAVVWMRFGAPIDAEERASMSIRDITTMVAKRMEAVADAVRTDAMAENDVDYRTVIRGKRSMEKKYDSVRW
ncbi:MAG: lysophospholipid acyltransferase family protein [Bacteroidetes bacterium]|nr:lysophospholipid acyltransferase family protein [Bacteroidota bacterium]